MMSFSKSGLLLIPVILLTSACTMKPPLEDAQYWQRKNATSALYLQGPKAQQTLHMDIAGCVNEINELQRLGALRKAMPGDPENGRAPDPKSPQGRMDAWETPKRDGYLYAEHSDYHDFETCMDAHGWERTEYLPYSVADRSRNEYLKNMGYQKRHGVSEREYVTSIHEHAQGRPPYKDLNE